MVGSTHTTFDVVLFENELRLFANVYCKLYMECGILNGISEQKRILKRGKKTTEKGIGKL